MCLGYGLRKKPDKSSLLVISVLQKKLKEQTEKLEERAELQREHGQCCEVSKRKTWREKTLRLEHLLFCQDQKQDLLEELCHLITAHNHFWRTQTHSFQCIRCYYSLSKKLKTVQRASCSQSRWRQLTASPSASSGLWERREMVGYLHGSAHLCPSFSLAFQVTALALAKAAVYTTHSSHSIGKCNLVSLKNGFKTFLSLIWATLLKSC